MNVLIADDNATNLKPLAAILEAEGHAVFSAMDGLEAFEILGRERIEAVVSDVLMPRMDGYRLCFEMRHDERFRTIPFVVYTNTDTSPGDEEFARQVGADRFLRKPASAAEIKKTISALRPHLDCIPPAVDNELLIVKEFSARLVAKLEEKNIELQRQTDELRAAREQLNSFFTAATAGLAIVDSQFRYVQINDTLAAINGLPVKDHLGKTIYEIIPEPAPKLEKIFRWVLATGKPALDVEASGILPGKPGVLRHWLASYFSLPLNHSQAIGAIVVEITDRKRAEQRLREIEQQFTAFMDNLPGFAWIKDVQGRYLYLSKSRERFTRFPKTWRGKTADQLWPPQLAAEYNAKHQKVLATRAVCQTIEPYPKKGGQGYMLASRFPIFDQTGAIILVGGVGVDITQYKQAEAEVHRSREQLRALAAHLQVIREEERARIAREIHDVLGETFTSLTMDVDWIEDHLDRSNASRKPSEIRQRLKSMAALLRTSAKAGQRIASDLRPGILDHLGLAATLDWAAKDWAHRTGIRCRWTRKPQPVALNREQATGLFRIYQEILTNISRHARARHVICSFKTTKSELTLRVTDDGRGFDPGKLSDRKSLGLIGMRERALLFSGTLEIQSASGQGTTITVRIPLVSTPETSRAKPKRR